MAALALPGTLVVLLAEVPVKNAVQIEPDLLVAGAVLAVTIHLLLFRWQSGRYGVAADRSVRRPGTVPGEHGVQCGPPLPPPTRTG